MQGQPSVCLGGRWHPLPCGVRPGRYPGCCGLPLQFFPLARDLFLAPDAYLDGSNNNTGNAVAQKRQLRGTLQVRFDLFQKGWPTLFFAPPFRCRPLDGSASCAAATAAFPTWEPQGEQT